MSNEQYEALINGLVALCQSEGLLPTTSEVYDELQSLAADEIYISRDQLEELF